jgi:hypothetical protein
MMVVRLRSRIIASDSDDHFSMDHRYFLVELLFVNRKQEYRDII